MRAHREKLKAERKAYLEEHPVKVYVGEPLEGKATMKDAVTPGVTVAVEIPEAPKTPEQKQSCGNCAKKEGCDRKRVVFYSTYPGAQCQNWRWGEKT